jgi:PadR family transcriptional regulator, regulatory protein PadR
MRDRRRVIGAALVVVADRPSVHRWFSLCVQSTENRIRRNLVAQRVLRCCTVQVGVSVRCNPRPNDLTSIPGQTNTSDVDLGPMAGLRMTVGVLAVLGALLDGPGTDLSGLEIVRVRGHESGTIYPILQRLRGTGWVSDRWEDPEPAHTEGRPPRRYYRLTVEGRARAVQALQHGRDRSGLSQPLAPLTSLPHLLLRQARYEWSWSTRRRGQQDSWRYWPQRSVGKGMLLSGSRAGAQFAALGLRPAARWGEHGLVGRSDLLPCRDPRPGPATPIRAQITGRCRNWCGPAGRPRFVV